MIGAMYPLIEAETCGLSADDEAEYRSPVAWARLCEQVLGDDSGKPVQETVCTGVTDARWLKVIELARVELRRAIRAPFLQRDADFLESGLRDAFRMGGEEGSRRAEEEANRHRMTVTEVMGRAPTSMRGDITVGELVRKHQARHDQLQKDIANPMQSKAVQRALKRSRNQRAASRRATQEFGNALQLVHDEK